MNISRIIMIASLVLLFAGNMFSQGRVINTTMPCRLLDGITEREYSIYLPESYDKDENRKYPVCYLLHGGNCACTDWDTFGRLRIVADSLIQCGEMKEMIFVCPEGNKNNMIWFNAPHWKYEDFFFNEFVPYIESEYRILGDRDNRFIAGYSMGGGASIVYGLSHPDMFAAVYSMSGYLRRQYMEFLKNDPSVEWRQQLVEDHNPIRRVSESVDEDIASWKNIDWFIDCGDKDFTYEANIDMVQAFRDKGINYQLRVYGGGHDWDYWRPSLIRALKHVSSKIK